MEAAEQQHCQDIEQADNSRNTAHLRQVGLSKLDAVLSKAKAGHDPWEFQQQPKKGRDADAEEEHEPQNADVAAFGSFLDRNRPWLLAGAFAVAQGGSWVLMKVRRVDVLGVLQTVACEWSDRG